MGIICSNENIFIEACNSKNSEKCMELLDKKIYYGHIDKHGNSLLMLACKNKMDDVALKLLKKVQHCEYEKNHYSGWEIQ